MSRARVALVTGSATGIGRSAAWLLAEQGYAVTVNYSKSRSDAEETADGVRSRGAKALIYAANVADDTAVRAMVERTTGELGALDVLVNNAGTTHFIPHSDLEALTAAIWDEILDVNLKGTFFACRAALPYLKARQGAIVNVASVAGLAGTGSSIAYAASKGAMITLTKSLARAFAPEVRVNAVAPGPVQTRWLADHQDMVEQAMKVTPLKRPATADDIAEAILFLAHTATLMTGQVLVVDGGRTM
jgi:3-oxoacyl-[acyl-carrier protein] reductase